MSEPLRLTKLFHVDEVSGHFSHDTTYIGIDFGTSTTVVSLATYNHLSEEIECRSLQLPQKINLAQKCTVNFSQLLLR